MGINEHLKKRIQDRETILWALAVLLIATLLPLLVIGRYNVLSADDYAMSKEAVGIWRSTHSVGEILQYACRYTVHVYQTWQGGFTINFLDCFNPGVFGEQWAWLTPVVMLASILGFSYAFFRNVTGIFFDNCHREAVICWAAWSFLSIQALPSPVEGLYWYSGAIAYTFLHYFMLFVFSFVLKESTGKKGAGRIVRVTVLSLGMFLVGGSQYITVLECLIVYILVLAMRHKHLKADIILPAVFLVAGFGINIMAPGNSARRMTSSGMSPIRAILRSFFEAACYARKWCTPLTTVCLLFMVPFIWHMLSRAKKKYGYRYPAAVSALSFCVFAAAFTPSLYGVGNVEAGRIQNLIQSVFYITVIGNLFYWIGWLRCSIEQSEKEPFRDLKTVLGVAAKYVVSYQWLLFFLIFLVFAGTGDKNTFSSISALRSLVKGEARAYYMEAQERLEIYHDADIKIAEVKAFSVKPHVLFFNDIQAENNSDYWINENIAAYYGKEKVILIEDEDA